MTNIITDIIDIKDTGIKVIAVKETTRDKIVTIEKEVFSSDLKAYLNVGGFLRGTGPDDMMGFASTYISPNKWYTKIGGAAESERCGVELLNIAKAQSYFMVGNDVDSLPLPPTEVLEKLSYEQQEKLKKRTGTGLSDGKGIAFLI